MMRAGLPAVVATLCATICGCDQGPKVHRVHGTVTTESGRPAPSGMIYFDPEVNRDEECVQGFAYIKDGSFDTALEGRGVSGGKYQARVKLYDGVPKKELPLGEALGPEESFPLDFPDAESEQKLQLKAS